MDIVKASRNPTRVWTREEVERWLAENDLDDYQSVPLPYGLKTPGKDRAPSVSVLTTSVDMKGRTYCDIGCAYGAMVFEVEWCGATAYGCDHHRGKLQHAATIASMKGSDATFFRLDIDTTVNPQLEFDVVSCFNVIHHLKHPFLALHSMFSMARDYFMIEYLTLEGRFEHLCEQAGFLIHRSQSWAIGVTPFETGIFVGELALNIIAGWYGFEKMISRPSPMGAGRHISLYERKRREV